MKKYPFVKQDGIKDCASACVQMILKYYGGYTSMTKLNEMMRTSHKGTDAYHLVLALQELGFKAEGRKFKNFYFPLPVIAHVIINDSYKHYVVIYEVDFRRRRLLIGDPSFGLRRLSFDEFKKMWTGVIITIKPVRKLIKEEEPKVIPFVLKLVRPNVKSLILIGGLSFVVSVLAVVTSFFLQVLINYLNKDFDGLFDVCGIFLVVFLAYAFLKFFRNSRLIKLNREIDSRLSIDTFKKIVHLPYRFFRQRTTGEITSYFNDLFWIREFIMDVSIAIFTNLPIMIMIFLVMAYLNFGALLIVLFICLLYFLDFVYYFRKNEIKVDQALYEKAFVNSYMTERIGGFESVKNLDMEGMVISKFRKVYEKYLSTVKDVDITYNKQSLDKEIVHYFGLFFLIIYIFLEISKGMVFSEGVTLFILAIYFLDNFRNILGFDLEVKEVTSAVKHVSELLNYNKQKKIRKQIRGDIRFTNVSYSFDDEKKVLDGISLVIKQGEKVMVTGKSGSGKSTLFKILKGFYNDYQGKIFIGNKDIRQLNVSGINYICQKETIFTGTLKDNLELLGKYDQRDICEIKDIGLEYDDLLEENGFNLSGGQRQRIILARALNNFNILIIDEGLSEVDVNMERRIIKGLLERYKNKTIIYVSHRRDNLDLFDRLVEINDGKILTYERRV
ncbi:MAG TPA: peptidase domain-containing ABC transporter [Candidatus Coprosoma intestinipullorum]|uniref:Peptidase domain-containing ABC transporter n=1 Tax=Candidatus Coprosoma intestinipullorum TaxID=2840752 RepID=A0A9D0ZR18_9FIRM|nr:peptidase domain-containing ABC transporter [Candidatus Coprosoma intestinipullorum]